MSRMLDSLLLEEMEQMDARELVGDTVADDFIDAEDGFADDELYLSVDYDPNEEEDEDNDGDPNTGLLDDPDLLEDDEIIDQVIAGEDDPDKFYEYDDGDEEGGEI